eukprot:9467793-Pyramimonas_sp.AAC.1
MHSDVSERVFERCLYTAECPPVGLLIRTSGETRLSDFMGWQCAHATLVFLEVRFIRTDQVSIPQREIRFGNKSESPQSSNPHLVLSYEGSIALGVLTRGCIGELLSSASAPVKHALLIKRPSPSQVLWPDFSFWDLVGALVAYQRSHHAHVALTESGGAAAPAETLEAAGGDPTGPAQCETRGEDGVGSTGRPSSKPRPTGDGNSDGDGYDAPSG